VVWVGSYTGLWCCGVDAIGDMWAFLLGLYVVVVSFGIVVYVLFSRVVWCLFVSRFFVMGLGEHGRWVMWVYGCGVRCCVGSYLFARRSGLWGGTNVLQVFLGLRGGC
jgi:hypothetical protein